MFRMSPIYLTIRDSLIYHRFRADMIMTYNILHNNINLNQRETFKLRSTSITQGHNYKIFKPHAHTETC